MTGNRKWLARDSKSLGIEGGGHQVGVENVEQIARFDVGHLRIGVHEQRRTWLIERREINRLTPSSGHPVAELQVEKMSSIGQKCGPPIAQLTMFRIKSRDRRWLSAAGSNPIERVVVTGRKQNRSVAVPCTAPAGWSVADNADGAARRGNSFQFSISEKREILTVG